ncbi:hypothetical protein Acor_13680 [Acrocarpospora corrugata]|uniref:DNA-3-methyladenine glycosylase II n=1 Tax=Acrocarpospora corrugata TaxID=35763 RepID=A0A5M3VR97_9ACTN|nr:hypothetical protein [Acrocarpospora corrugata]GER99304.1 hypothetical protein Acor_13680 [Acrocarpospora corrugata]
MLDHPAWDTHQGRPVRATRTASGPWLVSALPYEATPLADATHPPIVDRYDPAIIVERPLPSGLRTALEALGPVTRLRTADLWESLATAIIRQVIRSGQARAMHRTFRSAIGQQAGPAWLIPAPEQVIGLGREVFAKLGMSFKCRPLQAAADAYLRHRGHWAELPPDVLVKEIQTIPRIGPWTAGAAVADYSGDFAFYPHADLAVRTWASRADPLTDWPDEREFAALWSTLAGPHLSTLTVLTLAWGDHHAHQSALADQGSAPD